MAYNHMSAYQEGILGALMRQPGSVHEGSLGVLMRQPGSVHEGSLGILMRQPGSVHEGSLGVLMRQPGSVHEGSLGALMRQPGSVHEGSLGVTPRRRIWTAASPLLQGIGLAPAPMTAPGTSVMMAPRVAGMPAYARAAAERARARAECQARCYALPTAKRPGCLSGCSRSYPVSGLGALMAPPGAAVMMRPPTRAMPASARAAMERARDRAECRSRCYALPSASRTPCLSTCLATYPLTGLGADGDAAAAAAREAAEHATTRVSSEQAASAATIKASQAAAQAAAATHPIERAAAESAASAAAAAAAQHTQQAQAARAAEISAVARMRMIAASPHRPHYPPWAAAAAIVPPGQRVRRRATPWFGQYGRAAKTIGKGFSKVQHYAETPERYIQKVPVVGTAAKAAKTVIEAPIKAITSLFGLGAAPQTVAAKMASATARAVCLKNCEKRPGAAFAPCVSSCLNQYPLHGLGAETPAGDTSWLWIVGGVALLGAVVVMASR